MAMFVTTAASLLVSFSLLAPAQNAPVPPPAGPSQGGATAPQNPGQPMQPVQPGGLQLKPPLLVQQLPDAMTCPAPEWIVPGMRITYFTSVAQIEDSAGAVKLVPDPNGNITDSNGNRFSEGNPVGNGVGGAGWDCLDVVAVEDGVVVLTMRQFQNLNGLQGPCKPFVTSSFLVHPAGCDYYIHPKLLNQLQESSNDGISLLKGTINHRGTTYNSVRSTVEIPNTRLSSMYDLASGVQLTHNSSTQHDGGTVYRQSGDKYDPQRKSGRSLANNQFHGVRKLGLPWEDMKMPEWVKTTKALHYRGMITDTGTPEMGLGNLQIALSIDLTTGYVGKTFSAYSLKVTQQFQGMAPIEGGAVIVASGPGSYDGIWMDPAVLQKLEVGQMLDADPNTEVQVGIDYKGQGPNGGNVIVIKYLNSTYQLSAMYDLIDGRLLAANRMEKSESTGGTKTTQYELVGME